jgi:predicted kinase
VTTLFLTCGLQGSGKTTLAKRLEIEHERPAQEEIALFDPETT